MPRQIGQPRLPGWFEDMAIHAELKKARKEREEARTAMSGALADGSAFRALRKACRKLGEVMQASEDTYMEVYSERSPKLGTLEAGTGTSKAGERHRVRRWEARSTSGTNTKAPTEARRDL